jgi:hypothetical protein
MGASEVEPSVVRPSELREALGEARYVRGRRLGRASMLNIERF